jgi:hypothetical protein
LRRLKHCTRKKFAKAEATKDNAEAANDNADEDAVEQFTANAAKNNKQSERNFVHTAASLFKDLLQGGTWVFLLVFAAILPIDCKVCTEQWCSFLCHFQLCPILVSSLVLFMALKIKLKWINDDVSMVHFVIFGVIFGFICWFTLTTYREDTIDDYDIEWLKINCGEPWVTSHTLQNGTIEWKRAEKDPEGICERMMHAHRLKVCAWTMAYDMIGRTYVKQGHESCNEFWERASGNAQKYISWVDNAFNLLPTVKEMAKTEEPKLVQAYSEITWWYGLATCMFIAATCASCVNTVGRMIPQAWFWIYIGLFLYVSVSTYAYTTSPPGSNYQNFYAFKIDCVHALRVPMQWVSDCIYNWSQQFKEFKLDKPEWIVWNVIQIAAVNILGFLFDRQCQNAIFIVYILVIVIIMVKFNYAAIRAQIDWRVVKNTLAAFWFVCFPGADGFSVHGNTQRHARQMLLAQQSSLLPDAPWWLVLAFMFFFSSVLYYGIWQWKQADKRRVFLLVARVFMTWSFCSAFNSFTSLFQHWLDKVQCAYIMYITVQYILNPYEDRRLQRIEEALRLKNE